MYIDNNQYAAYLCSEKWHRIAKQRMRIDKFRCCMCGCSGTMNNRLEVHHLSYRHLYQEENWIEEDLETLCHSCHKSVHRAMNRVTDVKTGRQGWKDSHAIPSVHCFDLPVQTDYIEQNEHLPT